MTLIIFFKETVGPDQKRDKIVQLRSLFGPRSFIFGAAIRQEKLGDNEPECIAEMTGAIFLGDAAQNIWTINTAQEKAEVHSGSKNRSDQKLRRLAKQ